jgi:hypothetical protein
VNERVDENNRESEHKLAELVKSFDAKVDKINTYLLMTATSAAVSTLGLIGTLIYAIITRK